MEEKIRNRMLVLIGLYRERTERILEAQMNMAMHKARQESRHAELIASLVPGWQDKATAGNEQSRKAQVDGLLLADPLYQEAHNGYALAENALREGQLALDTYRFERDILIAIANNDGDQLPPGTMDPRD